MEAQMTEMWEDLEVVACDTIVFTTTAGEPVFCGSPAVVRTKLDGDEDWTHLCADCAEEER